MDRPDNTEGLPQHSSRTKGGTAQWPPPSESSEENEPIQPRAIVPVNPFELFARYMTPEQLREALTPRLAGDITYPQTAEEQRAFLARVRLRERQGANNAATPEDSSGGAALETPRGT